MQVETIPRYQQLFGRYPFDFIILSVHQIENKEFWTQEFQQGKTQDEYIQRYYREILEIVRRYKDYSALDKVEFVLAFKLSRFGRNAADVLSSLQRMQDSSPFSSLYP